MPLFESNFKAYTMLMTDLTGIFYSTAGDQQYNKIFTLIKPHLTQA